MATLYLKTAGGNWSAAGTWSNVNASGVDNSGPPTAATDVILELLSGNVTIDGTSGSPSLARSVDATSGTGSYTGTITMGATAVLTIGDGTAGAGGIALKLPSGLTFAPNAASTINFVSTSGTAQAITINTAYTAGFITINGAGSNYNITANLNVATAALINVINGTLHVDGPSDVSGLTHSWGALQSNAAGTRTIKMGTSNVTLTTNSAAIAFSSTTQAAGFTWDAGTGTITLSGTAGNVNLGVGAAGTTNAFYNLVFSGAGTYSLNSTAICSANTFTWTGTAAKTNVMSLGQNWTITTTLTLTGQSDTNRLLFQSGTLGTARTITYNSATNPNTTIVRTDFKDITEAGSFGAWNLSGITGGSGDCGGNSGITFSTSTPQYWFKDTGNWSNAALWFLGTGGTGGAGRVPLPQDDAIFDINSFSAGSKTVTLDMPRAGRDITWTGVTNTPAWAKTTATTMYRSLTMVSGMTNSGTVQLFTFESNARSGTLLFTSGTVTFSNSILIAVVGATLQNQDALTCTGSVTLVNGTWDTNGVTVVITLFQATGSATRGILLGLSSITLNSTGTIWNTTTAGLTISAASSTIIISNTTQGTSKTFAAGTSQTYGNLTLSGKNIILTFTTAITFATIALNNLGDTTGVTFPASKTITATGFTSTASAGNVAKLISSLGGTQATLSIASGTISVDYCTITDNAAAGSIPFYAGVNSTLSNTTNWNNTAPPSGGAINQLLMLLGIGS